MESDDSDTENGNGSNNLTEQQEAAQSWTRIVEFAKRKFDSNGTEILPLVGFEALESPQFAWHGNYNSLPSKQEFSRMQLLKETLSVMMDSFTPQDKQRMFPLMTYCRCLGRMNKYTVETLFAKPRSSVVNTSNDC